MFKVFRGYPVAWHVYVFNKEIPFESIYGDFEEHEERVGSVPFSSAVLGCLSGDGYYIYDQVANIFKRDEIDKYRYQVCLI